MVIYHGTRTWNFSIVFSISPLQTNMQGTL
ncbi:MAG: hypothetical protein KGY41_05215 [Desulfovermiculus sp.]|nr:hypothetical protein [Desulfovermiculus sp.]